MRFLLAGILIAAALASTGCYYYSYQYAAKEVIEDTPWKISFNLISVDALTPVNEGGPGMFDAGAETLFFYTVCLKETDTTTNPRLDMEVRNVTVRYRGDTIWTPLSQHGIASVPDQHVGATSVNHCWEFGPLRVPVPRPDTLYFAQDILVYYSDSHEDLKEFHYETAARLHRYRYWNLIEFLRGT